MSPDLLHDVQSSRCVRTIVLTAGDAGQNQAYWQGRESGLEAAIAQMANLPNTWTTSDAGVAGHAIKLAVLDAAPRLSIAFVRLPDGNMAGEGFTSTGFGSLQKLWSTTISSLPAVDGSASYTRQGLIDTLISLVTSAHATRIDSQDYLGAFGDGDHSDHHAAGFFTRAASQSYASQHLLVAYQGYASQSQPVNVAGADLSAKETAYFTYSPFDNRVCQNMSECTTTEGGAYANWLQRQYTVGSEGSEPAPRSGYWMVGTDGVVYAFGDAAQLGNAPDGVHIEATPTGNGYWIVNTTGNVYAYGDAPYLGGINGALSPGETVTSLSATPSGNGYWLFTTLGRVVAFGDATFYGDMSATHLNGPVTGSIPTPSGHGYYMVASDGGIFSFGDAQFYGSMGATRLNAPVKSLVPDGDGVGYWLVASDGGIFAFQANFYGSMGATPLNKPITGMVASGTAGYLMVAEDGGIFAFGTADFHGSLGNNPPAHPITSVAALPR